LNCKDSQSAKAHHHLVILLFAEWDTVTATMYVISASHNAKCLQPDQMKHSSRAHDISASRQAAVLDAAWGSNLHRQLAQWADLLVMLHAVLGKHVYIWMSGRRHQLEFNMPSELSHSRLPPYVLHMICSRVQKESRPEFLTLGTLLPFANEYGLSNILRSHSQPSFSQLGISLVERFELV
jgi:hypothetical protein